MESCSRDNYYQIKSNQTILFQQNFKNVHNKSAVMFWLKYGVPKVYQIINAIKGFNLKSEYININRQCVIFHNMNKYIFTDKRIERK